MDANIVWQVVTKAPEETEALAAKIGRRLKGGEVIELISDLGGGKTTFVKGLLHGMGSESHVSSPTFTISKVYKAPSREVFHFDFYRLQEAGLMAEELAEATEDPQAVVVVEWADVVQHVLPANRLTVRIEHTPEGDRRLQFSCPETLGYTIEALGEQ